MSTLFQIEQNLIDLFNTIEDNDGEITQEQIEQLEINENNLKEKLDNYRKAIKEWDSDIDKCKTEAKRLNEIAKVRENRIKRLKSAMVTAVTMFGQSGKTNKFIELEDCRLSTKNTKSVEINESRIEELKLAFLEIIKELADNNILYARSDIDLEGILSSINAIVKANNNYEGEFIPYTLEDLMNIEFEITTKHSIHSLMKWYSNLTEYLAINDCYTIKEASSKSTLKNIILDEDSKITCAKLIENTSILIK